METLAFSHLAYNTDNSDNQEFTACVDFKKLSNAGAVGLLSAAAVVGAMGVTADSAFAYGYGGSGGYGNYGNSGGYGSYGRNSGHYYKKVVSSSYNRSYGNYGRYNRYGNYGGYGGYGGGYGGGRYGCY